MRSKFGTALALVAVLLTGTAAAAINTQALISPTESTLGTAATTLLPIDPAAAVVPDQTQITPVAPTQTLPSSQSNSKATSKPANSSGSAVASIPTLPTANQPVVINPPTVEPPATVAPSPNPTSVVYGNPNPSNGDDDDDDDEDDDDDDEDDD